MFSRKNNFWFLLIFVLLSISIVYAEESPLEETTESISFVSTSELNLSGNQLAYVKQQSGAYEFKFLGENSSLEVNGLSFDNIKYNSKSPGKITIGRTGEVSYAKFSTNENGDVYTMGGITFEAPPNSEVFYDRRSGKVTITSTQDSALKSNPSFAYCEKGSPRCSGKDIEFYAKSGTITLPSGHILESGKIIKDANGEFSVSPASKVVINGVEVSAYDRNKKYSLFFDKEGNSESYVSFSKNKVSGKMIGGVLINFKENNPYSKIEEGDLLRIGGNDGRFELSSNSDSGKISSLDLYGNSRVWNDGKFLEYDHDTKKTLFSRGSEHQMKKIDGKTSTPMEISFFDLDKNPVLSSSRSKTEYKILFDNFDRFAVIPRRAGDEFYSESEGVDTKFSSRLRYNYIDEEELQILTGNKIKFEGGDKSIEDELSDGSKSLMLGRARDYYDTLTQETKDSITNIYLADNLGEKAQYAALYNKIDKSIYMSTERMDLLSFRHEMAHSLEYPMTKSSDFKKSWGDIYSESDSSKIEYKYSKWRDGAVLSEYPKEGLIRPYSLKTESEHIATYLEPLSTNPAFFKDLINPKSPKYDPKYMDSIDLLYKYKFISKEEYNNVLREAGFI